MVIGVIDDDDGVRESTRALLEVNGYEVHAYESAETFLAASETSLNFLVVDQHMPGLEGTELIEQIRAAGQTTPTVIMTGQDDELVRARARRVGVRVLRKPVSEDDLVTAIEREIVR